MTDTFVELYPDIVQERMLGPVTGLGETRYALLWLDEHPDQLPGRTITESELKNLSHDYYSSGRSVDAILSHLGITVVPDPEPTNAEKLKAVLDAIGDSTDGYREHLASKLDEAGVRAPEVVDD